MHNHYVPQYYLKGFCNSSLPSMIARYDKGKRRAPLFTNVKNVAQEKGFYSDEVEESLATKIEQPANAVLDKIRTRNVISSRERRSLCNYMAAMLMRVPRSKERVSEAMPKAMARICSDLDQQISRLIQARPVKAEIYERRREEAQQLREKLESEVPEEIWNQLVLPSTTSPIIAHLNAMTWQFLTFDDVPSFMTSDNPVFLFEGIGIGSQNSEVTLPISQSIALWATWRMDLEEGFFPTRRQIVREINARTVYSATRYVFYPDKKQWVENFVNRKTFLLNRICDENATGGSLRAE